MWSQRRSLSGLGAMLQQQLDDGGVPCFLGMIQRELGIFKWDVGIHGEVGVRTGLQ